METLAKSIRRAWIDLPYAFYIRCAVVEFTLHVFAGQLRESSGLKPKVLHGLVDTFDLASWPSQYVASRTAHIHTTDGLKHVVCKCRASMRCCYSRQGEDLEIRRTKTANHIS